MSKYIHILPNKLMALALALLFSIFFLAACGAGAGSSISVTSTAINTAVSDTAVRDQARLEMMRFGTVAPDTSVGFDCGSVNQIPSVECEALAALYKSTNGPGWDDNTGWLAYELK